MTYFTTVDDVVSHLVELEPQFTADLTHDELQAIVREHRVNRYEEITESEIDTMYAAAMERVVATA